MKNNQQLSLWYSAKGAKRGGVLALLFAALWLCWAIGYTQAWQQIESALPLTLSTRQAPTVHGANHADNGGESTTVSM